MSIENLGGFNSYQEGSDESEFDIKQSSREDINMLNISQPTINTSFDQMKGSSIDVDDGRKQRASLFADAVEKFVFHNIFISTLFDSLFKTMILLPPHTKTIKSYNHLVQWLYLICI